MDSEKCLKIGEMVAAFDSRAISLSDINGKIGDIVSGRLSGRDNTNDITVFESDGTHIQSGAVVNLIYEKVKQKGLGREVDKISDFFINP